MYYVNPISLANKVLNRLEIKAGSSRLIFRPVEVTVEPTLMCNSDCLMCKRNFHRRGDRNVLGFLTRDILNKVKPFLRSAEKVVFSGFGEPLLHPKSLDMARMGMAGEPTVSGRRRMGDIRHSYADLTLSRRIQGDEPTGRFDDGNGEFLSWEENEWPLDLLEAVRDELRARGLLGGEGLR